MSDGKRIAAVMWDLFTLDGTGLMTVSCAGGAAETEFVAELHPSSQVVTRADASPLLNIATPYDVHRFPPGLTPREFFRRVMGSMKTEVLHA